MRQGTFDIAMPPRSVPLSVTLSLLSGGWLNQIGWGLVAFGGIFAWVFAANADFASWYHFRGEIRNVAGMVTGVEKTAFSTGSGGGRRSRSSSHRKGKPIYEVRYRYSPAADISREGKSYFTHTSSVSEPSIKSDVEIEHPADRPDISRIKGMRRKPFHGALGLIALIPATGLFMVLRGFQCGAINAGLLRRGRPAMGRLIHKRATGATVNKQQVWALTFEYIDGEGAKHQTVVKTHHEEHLTDEDAEKLLYDPGHPRRAVLIDSLPGTPGLNEMGNVRPVSTATVAARMVLPIVGLGVAAVTVIQMMR